MMNGTGGMCGSMGTMDIQAMQQRREQMLNKVDSNSDGGVDQAELEAFALKISEKTGNSINVDDAISTYDVDGSGTLNMAEITSFMKENIPRPNGGLKHAMSTYGMNMGNSQVSSLFDLLQSQSDNEDSSTASETNSDDDQISNLLEMLKSRHENDSSSTPLRLRV